MSKAYSSENSEFLFTFYRQEYQIHNNKPHWTGNVGVHTKELFFNTTYDIYYT